MANRTLGRPLEDHDRGVGRRLSKEYHMLTQGDDSIDPPADLVRLEEADLDHEEQADPSDSNYSESDITDYAAFNIHETQRPQKGERAGGLTHIGYIAPLRRMSQMPAVPLVLEQDIPSFIGPMVSKNRQRGRDNPLSARAVRDLKKQDTLHGMRVVRLAHPKTHFYH